MGNLKNDSNTSIKCPDYVNTKLQKSVVRGWTLITGKCTRGKTGGYNAQNLNGLAPFRQNGKCYQRTIWCSEEGKIHAFDREYVNWETAYGVKPVINALGDANDDHTTRCPAYVSPSLRINTVNDWYLVKGGCTKNGFQALSLPFSKKAKCYQRLQFCSVKKNLYYKDQ